MAKGSGGSGFMEGSSIRIGLDLVATASGIGALTQLGQALTNLVYIQAGLPSGASTWLSGVGAAAAGAALDAAMFDAALKTIVDDASQLQFSSTQMDLALHGTQAQIDALNPAIIQWADNSLYTTAQVHQLVQALSEHGLDVTSILHGDGQAAIQLGEAIGGDPVESADLLASALQEFSSQGLNATDAANILTAAYYNGIPSASELQTALQEVGGQAATMGVPFKDLATTLDLLAQSGMSGASAGTSLRYVLQNIADPTTKAATDMNFLGLTVVNTTSPAFRKLKDELDNAGAAGQAAVAGFDGTSVGLNAMFKAAQKLGLLPLNETFNAWATASGAMSSKLFDAQGKFIGLQGTIEQIVAAIQAKAKGNPELAAQMIDDMFNVRSGRAIQLLTNVKNFKDHYNRVLSEIGKTSASKDAQTELDTLQGATAELKTTLTSLGATIGNTLLPPLTQLVQHINQFAGWVMKLNPDLLKFLGIFVGVGAVLSTITALVAALVVVFMVVAAVAGTAVIVTFGIVIVVIIAVAAIIALLIVKWQGIIWVATQVKDHVGQFFSWLGTAAQHAVMTVGGWFSWLGTQAQHMVSTVGGWFSHLGTAAHNAVTTVGQWFSWLGTEIHGRLMIAVGHVKQLWAEIPVLFQIGLHKAEQIVQQVMQTIGGWFGWLYNHNYYFQDLVDFIRNAWKTIRADAIKAWNAVTGWLSRAWNTIKNEAIETWTNLTTQVGGVFNQLGTKLHQAIQGIQAFFEVIWKLIVKGATDQWNTLTSTVGGIFNGLGSRLHAGLVGIQNFFEVTWKLIVKGVEANFHALQNTMGAQFSQLGTLVHNKLQDIGKFFSDFGTQMHQFGQVAMQMFIKGLQAEIGALGNVLTTIANKIKSVLGFHSPPAEGPLSDSDQYMPNMMRMFATGITGNSGLFTGALNQVALAGRTAVSGGLLGLGGVAGVAGSQGQSVANFNVDGKTLFSVMMDRLTGEMRLNNLGTQWR